MAVSDLRRLMNQPVELDISESRNGGTALSRSHILEAALASLHEDGFEATTIRAIARRLDCAVGSIYRYFPDKRSLVRQCGERLLLPVVEPLKAGDATLGESKRRYIAAARTNEELYRMMFWLVDDDQRLPAVVGRIIAGWTELLDSGDAARLHWASVHATVLLGREVNLQTNATPMRGDRPDNHGSAPKRSADEDGAVKRPAVAIPPLRVDDVTLL